MKIPENQNPYRVIINGVEKQYPAGQEVDVPADVAEIIETGKSFPPAAPDPVPPITIPEQGGGGGGSPANAALVVGGTLEGDTITLDKTWQEIHDGNYVAVIADVPTGRMISQIVMVFGSEDYYEVKCVHADSKEVAELPFSCDSPDGYPALTMG